MLHPQLKQWLAIVLMAGLMSLAPAMADPVPTISGTWLTIDDQSGKPRGIMQISEQNGAWQGQLVKVYYRPGEGPQDVCKECTDPAHKNQRILGMVLLWGMQIVKPYEWSNGYILDPKNGHIYRCNITLNPDNKTLHVRGYIGIPLIGRSQTWQRLSAGNEEP